MIDGTMGSGIPSLSTLQRYDVVIWVHSGCGYYRCSWGNPMAINADDVLMDFLDGGGRLLISGQDISSMDGDNGFYDRYLNADLLSDDGAAETESITGLNFLDGLALEITNASLYGSSNSTSYLSLMQWPAAVDLSPVLTYDVTDTAAALAVAPCREDYRAVYLAMGYENVAPRADLRSDDMSALVVRSIDWLTNSQPLRIFHINSMVEELSGAADSRQDFTILLENNGVDPLDVSLALSGANWPVSLLFESTPVGDSLLIDGCSSAQLHLWVEIPHDAQIEETDTVTLTVTSPQSLIPTQSATYVTRMMPQWQAGSPMQNSYRDAMVTTVPGSPNVYIMGGFSDFEAVADVSVYDACSDAWSSTTSLPVPLAAAAIGTIGRKVYVAGGVANYDLDSQSTISDKLWIYDLDTGAWQEGPPLPFPVVPSSGAVWRDRFYVLGGYDSNGYTELMLYFDVTTAQWIILEEPLPFSDNTYSTSAATLNDEIYVVNSERSWDDMNVYSPADNTWRMATGHQIYRYAASLIADGGYLYLVGGYTSSGYGAERYDPVLDDWTLLSSFNYRDRAGAAVGVANDRLIVTGGRAGTAHTEILVLSRNFCDSTALAVFPSVGVGETLELEIVLETNDASVVDARFTAPIPPEITFDSFVENPLGAIYNAAGHNVEWQGTLPGGASISTRFSLRAPNDATPETTYNGTVTFDGAGHSFTRSWWALVQAADFSLSEKLVHAPTIIEGERLTYTVDLRTNHRRRRSEFPGYAAQRAQPGPRFVVGHRGRGSIRASAEDADVERRPGAECRRDLQ
ncbi:MAG: hypothetical protein R2873_08410 [Caldilineaceae bacterium]